MAQPAIDVTIQVSTNSKATARDIELYAHVVDLISDWLDLRRWAIWTGFATASRGRWPGDFDVRTYEVQHKLQTTLWPGSLPELELSATALGYIVAEAYRLFTEHCRSRGDGLEAHPFYHEGIGNPDLYTRLLNEYYAWERACDLLVYEATAVVNWFADVVRRDLNPDFFRYQGRFTVRDTTFPSLRGGVGLCLYDDETRPKDLDALEQRVAEIVAPYRALVKEHEASVIERRRSTDPE